MRNEEDIALTALCFGVIVIVYLALTGCGQNDSQVETARPGEVCEDLYVNCEFLAYRAGSHLAAFARVVDCSFDLGHCARNRGATLCRQTCEIAVAYSWCMDQCPVQTSTAGD